MKPAPAANESIAPACDCHWHVFARDVAAPGARYAPAYDATLRDWQARATVHGMVRGVVVQPSFLANDNSMLLATVRADPANLRGVAVVDVNVSHETLSELRAQGVRGIRLNLFGDAHDVDALRALPSRWWAALISANVHLELHADVGRIAALLQWIPHEIALVLDHCAKPERARAADATVRAVRTRAQRAETHVTLSGAYRQAPTEDAGAFARDLAQMWLGEIGPQRLLWASDWPCTNHEVHADYARLFADLSDWIHDDAARSEVLQRNPQRVYWRD